MCIRDSDRIGSIVNTPVLEKLLLPSLHFYQNLFSFFIFTIDIKDSPAVSLLSLIHISNILKSPSNRVKADR